MAKPVRETSQSIDLGDVDASSTVAFIVGNSVIRVGVPFKSGRFKPTPRASAIRQHLAGREELQWAGSFRVFWAPVSFDSGNRLGAGLIAYCRRVGDGPREGG